MNKFDIANTMNEIMGSSTHQSVFSKPRMAFNKTAANKSKEDKVSKDEVKELISDIKAIMKDYGCKGTAKMEDGCMEVYCKAESGIKCSKEDFKTCQKEIKAACKKAGIKCNLECEYSEKKEASFHNYVDCVKGLASISETLDRKGLGKAATHTLLALDSLVKAAASRPLRIDQWVKPEDLEKTLAGYSESDFTPEDEELFDTIDPEYKELSDKSNAKDGKGKKGKGKFPFWMKNKDEDKNDAWDDEEEGPVSVSDIRGGGRDKPTSADDLVDPWDFGIPEDELPKDDEDDDYYEDDEDEYYDSDYYDPQEEDLLDKNLPLAGAGEEDDNLVDDENDLDMSIFDGIDFDGPSSSGPGSSPDSDISFMHRPEEAEDPSFDLAEELEGDAEIEAAIDNIQLKPGVVDWAEPVKAPSRPAVRVTNETYTPSRQVSRTPTFRPGQYSTTEFGAVPPAQERRARATSRKLYRLAQELSRKNRFFQ